jgi:hypothetical protein
MTRPDVPLHVQVAQRIVLAHSGGYEILEMGREDAVQTVCVICMAPMPCDALLAAKMLLRLEASAEAVAEESTDWWLPIWLELEAAGIEAD